MRFILSLLILLSYVGSAGAQSPVTLENSNFKIAVDQQTGVITSFLVKKNNSELVSEKKLAANFRIGLPLKDYLANYIDGSEQKAQSVTKEGNTIIVAFSGMNSPKGTYAVDLVYRIKMTEDAISFHAKLTNHNEQPISEFWFPRIGGWTGFGQDREAKLALPGYNNDCRQNIALFKKFPSTRGFGAEAAEWSSDYPGMTMPWWYLYDEKNDVGLYMGYHDTTFRYSTWHTYLTPNIGPQGSWLTPQQAGGEPVGITFSHVRYPFIHSGETFESGEFIISVSKGDWHYGALGYRKWFVSHFPIDKSGSWLRKKSAWFTSILYQPEDKIIADYKIYDQWTKEANKYGINCHELIGWDNGGLERNYPLYIPEDKLGGREGFKTLLKSIKDRGDHCLVFMNYNVLDMSTDWYKKDLHKYMSQDQFGNQAIWMGWGESTLLARKQLSVRYHVRSSVVPGIRKILDDFYVQLVKDGAQAFQIDKLVVGSSLDFNPLNTAKPDVALCQELVNAIDTLVQKCRAINPDVRMASEFSTDRFIPYFDVGYRNTNGAYGISPMRYMFPEWTACQHISEPQDFRGVNGAVLTGAVLCVEPNTYQGSIDQPMFKELGEYIKEIERIRKELANQVFLGKYYDNLGAKVTQLKGTDAIHYKVHGAVNSDQRSIIIANDSKEPVQYNWAFTHKAVTKALLYSPFEKVRTITQGEIITIKGNGLHIIVEKD